MNWRPAARGSQEAGPRVHSLHDTYEDPQHPKYFFVLGVLFRFFKPVLKMRTESLPPSGDGKEADDEEGYRALKDRTKKMQLPSGSQCSYSISGVRVDVL